MKYYIGFTEVKDGSRSYNDAALFVAKNTAQAETLLRSHTALWGGDGGQEEGTDVFSFAHGEFTTNPGQLHEISYVAFLDLRAVYTVVGDMEPGELLEGATSENVKTLSRRIGTQLTRHAAPVAHGKLLNAVAASIGETDWAVALHKRIRPPALPDGFDIREKRLAEHGEYAQYVTIEGFVDDCLMFSMSNHISGAWHVGSSSDWSGGLAKAERHLACITEVLRRAKEYALTPAPSQGTETPAGTVFRVKIFGNDADSTRLANEVVVAGTEAEAIAWVEAHYIHGLDPAPYGKQSSATAEREFWEPSAAELLIWLEANKVTEKDVRPLLQLDGTMPGMVDSFDLPKQVEHLLKREQNQGNLVNELKRALWLKGLPGDPLQEPKR
jgi:hypothetical protein